MKTFTFSYLICTLLMSFSLSAQITGNQSLLSEIARAYVRNHLSEWHLTHDDILDMQISHQYTDNTTGITRVYFQQFYKNIPVQNAILNINMTKEGNVYFTGNRFVSNLAEKINTTIPVLKAHEAVSHLAAHLGLSSTDFNLRGLTGTSKYVFEKNNMVKEEVEVALIYQPLGDKVMLAWDVLLSPAMNEDKWSTRIDAVSGKILQEDNWTLYCNADHLSFSDTQAGMHEPIEDANRSSVTLEEPQYHVWAFPVESPVHGPRTLVTNPADPIASPYGWHDINGIPGPEYSITKGNNAYTYHGRNDLGYSEGDEPDGGSNLHFDFPYDPLWEPEQYLKASAVNLFYTINYMHDFSYRFGFDEAAGNFQRNNYGRGGKGNDFMFGVTQSGANIGYKNNAFYKHGNDGQTGTIHMYIFTGKKKFLTVNAPAELAGSYFTSLPRDGWGQGAYVDSIPVSGEVVLLNDGIENPSASDGCEDIINASEIAGKIVFIERGGCAFSYKALKAQEAGVIGIIVANFDEDEYTMSPGPDAPQVNIPLVMIAASDARNIRNAIENGLNVSLVDPGEASPKEMDSSLDNGIVVHEYGHGISSRLVGGPDIKCLENDEQMGEGWSDFFALVTTVRPGDTGDMRRGFCAYPLRDPVVGKGFRRFPYSTDMDVMPLTYGDVALDQEVHALGEVWGSMLWDMYWAFVDQYGWSEDPFDPAGGNYKAIRLVMDGLKNTPCDPGFVDGRNAILAADEALYGGENSCLLWKVFARRGLGFSADQGSPFDAGDQTEAFDVLPVCSDQLQLTKSVDDLIQAGDEIVVNITVGNFRHDTARNVVITDIIPEHTSFKNNLSGIPADVTGDQVSFAVGDIPFGTEVNVSYSLLTSAQVFSERYFLDTVSPASDDLWLRYAIEYDGGNTWVNTDSLVAHSGHSYWYTRETSERSRQALELNPDVFTFHVEGEYPVLRFYHRYDTRHALNGGLVEVREVGAPAWTSVSEDMIRNQYPGELIFTTFSYPGIKAFSGWSGDEYIATYVDLRRWAGKEIQIRFRFGTWPNGHGGAGWLIDDVEFMDMKSYNSEACVTDDQGDHVCTIAPEAGTIVDTQDETVSVPSAPQGVSMHVFPNPANDRVAISIAGHGQQTDVSLMTIEGKELYARSVFADGNELLEIDTQEFPSGIYLLRLSTMGGTLIEKLVIQK